MCWHVQDCLRDEAVSVSWECQEELFRQEVENADDLRLSQRLFKKCMGDKKKFCSDIKFGELQRRMWSLCILVVCTELSIPSLAGLLQYAGVSWKAE